MFTIAKWLCFGLLAVACTVHAQPWAPTYPIRLVVPFPVGGGTDVVARLISEKMSARLGQSIFIDNKVGASGNIGTDFVAKSAADGHTLLLHITFMPTYKLTFERLPYDAFTDLTAIGTIAVTPMVVIAPASSPILNLQDLIARSKTKPGGLSYGSSGLGSPQHIAIEQLARISNAKLLHIPYKGVSLALSDLLGNQIDLAVVPLPLVLPQLEAKKVKAIVSLGSTRSQLAPEIPIAAELGVAGLESSVRFILLAPAKTPPEVITRLNAELNSALRVSAVQQGFAKVGFESLPSTPGEAWAMMHKEFDTMAPVIRSLNLAKQ